MIISFLKRGGGISLFFFLAGGVALFVAISDGTTGREMQSAESLTATVTALETRERRASSSNSNYSTRTDYLVTVAFAGGQSQSTVSAGFFDDLQQGQQITIRRLGDRVEIEPGSISSDALIALAIGIVAIAAALAMGWLALTHVTRLRHLRSAGLPAEGEIKGVSQCKLAVQFTDATGTEQSAALAKPVMKGFAPTDKGTRHPIRYDPAAPENAEFQAVLDSDFRAK